MCSPARLPRLRFLIRVSKMFGRMRSIGFGGNRKASIDFGERSGCRSCPQKEIDFGGCRCQAALLTGNAANTDPVCTLSPNRARVDAVLRDINSSTPKAFGADWTYRVNPKTLKV